MVALWGYSQVLLSDLALGKVVWRAVDYSCPNKVVTLGLIEIEGALHLLGLDSLSWQL